MFFRERNMDDVKKVSAGAFKRECFFCCKIDAEPDEAVNVELFVS